MSGESKYTFDKLIRWVGIAAVAVAVYLIVNSLSGVLLPFFIAWFFAYLLYPMVKFVQDKLRVRIRALAIVITLLVTIGAIVGVVWMVVPSIISQLEVLEKFVSNYVAQQSQADGVVGHIRDFLRENEADVRKYFESADFQNTMKSVVPKMFSLLGQTASVVFSIVASCIVILYLFFILMDYEYLTVNWVKAFPKKTRPFWRDVMCDVEKALNAYVRGQGLVSLIMGILFCIGFTIIDFPMAIGLGILVGVLNLVPYLHTFALIPTALLALLKAADTGESFWWIFGSAVAVFCIVQVINDFICVPKIMGKAMNLNPAVLLLSLSVWGSLLGFLGLILALPLTTIIFAYWKRYVTKDDEVVQDSSEQGNE